MEVQATAESSRGQNKGISEWNTGVKVEIKFDSTFQPVGDRAAQLKSQLGQIVRDGQRIPLTIIDWKSVGAEVKDGIWKEVKVHMSFIFVGKHLNERKKKLDSMYLQLVFGSDLF